MKIFFKSRGVKIQSVGYEKIIYMEYPPDMGLNMIVVRRTYA